MYPKIKPLIMKNRQDQIYKKNLENFKKVQELANSHNPLPVRNQKNHKVRSSIELHSNFINAKQNIFNLGKYKGVDLSSVPIHYMNWVVNNIKLNEAELSVIKKYIKQKSK